MSKYVLKRDLPFAKAGKSLNFMKTSSDQENFYLNDRTFFVSDAGFQKLIDEGWIEEVKPLEIWVNEFSNPTRHLGEYNYPTLKEAIEVARFSDNCGRTVHFIEVPEDGETN